MSSTDTNLPFAVICDFLDDLESLLHRYQAPKTKLTLHAFKTERTNKIETWNLRYNPRIMSDEATLLAVLSCLFPLLRRERKYFLQVHTISAVIARALGMGKPGIAELRNWKVKFKDKDFGLAVEHVVSLRVLSRNID
jgi:hypothetical protein